NSGEPLSIWLKYYAYKNNGWGWHPSPPSDGNHLDYSLATGESTYLNDAGWVITAHQVRLYALGLHTNKTWPAVWNTDLLLAPAEGYVATSDQTYTYTFNP